MKTPDLTQAQLLAALTWVASQAVANAWIDPGTGKTIVQIGGVVIAAVWILGDTLLRQARNKRLAAEASAAEPKPKAR